MLHYPRQLFLNTNIHLGIVRFFAELQAAKRIGCKAERHWLYSKLTVHKEIYIEAKMQVTKIVHNAKSEYFSSRLPNARIANSFLMLQIHF